MPLQESNLIVSGLEGKEEKALVRTHWIRVWPDSASGDNAIRRLGALYSGQGDSRMTDEPFDTGAISALDEVLITGGALAPARARA